MIESSRNDEAVGRWEELRDAGVIVWVGWDYATSMWAAQVKPKSQNLHEVVHADDFPDVLQAALVLAKERGWL